MPDLHRAYRAAALLAAVAWLTVAPACRTSEAAGQGVDASPALITEAPLGSEAAGQTTHAGHGRVIEGPENITRFAPADVSVRVNANTVNLRQVFEDLGPEATLWYQHVQTLANPFFEGRAPNTRGSELTAEYVSFWMQHDGLEPAFAADSYLQPFDYSVRDRLPDVSVESAELVVDGRPLEAKRDFVALGNSGSGQATGPLSFVGYGIASGPDGYSSFDEQTDLTGRVALLLRYAPMDESGHALWDERPNRWQAAVGRKMKSVADRGAAAILMVNPPGARESSDRLESLDASRRFGAGLEIPTMQISPQVADRLLAEAEPDGRDLLELQRLADQGLVTALNLRDTVQVSASTQVTRSRQEHQLTGRNVGGVLKGRGDLADEWIVIGAHHDHVGFGAHGGVMPSNRGQLHPGADDNASGTAGVLVLAGMLSEAYDEAPRYADLRSVLFVTFDGEEMGLKGSGYFADNTPIDPQKMTIMMNMDMIGRLRSRSLSVLGTQTGEGLADILKRHFEDSGLTVSVTGGGSGRSDDANFHKMSVPAIHFFTGMHREYTSPADQAYTVNPAGAAEVLDLMAQLAMDFADDPQKLVYQEPPSQGPGQDRGYGPVRLGIRPGMGEEVDKGVLVDGVSDGTSAAEAGVQAGDIIIGWDGMPIDGIADLFEHLQQHQPGDVVKLTVVRDGQRLELSVRLKAGGG